MGVDICLDPYAPLGFQQVVLNCPVVGTDYLKERAPVIRTWSKVTEDGENIVLFSAPDSENPLPNYFNFNFLQRFPDSVIGLGSGPILLGFGITIEESMIRDHSLIFFANFTNDFEPEDMLAALGTWICTVSNSSGSDTALTTLSICGKKCCADLYFLSHLSNVACKALSRVHLMLHLCISVHIHSIVVQYMCTFPSFQMIQGQLLVNENTCYFNVHVCKHSAQILTLVIDTMSLSYTLNTDLYIHVHTYRL